MDEGLKPLLRLMEDLLGRFFGNDDLEMHNLYPFPIRIRIGTKMPCEIPEGEHRFFPSLGGFRTACLEKMRIETLENQPLPGVDFHGVVRIIAPNRRGAANCVVKLS